MPLTLGFDTATADTAVAVVGAAEQGPIESITGPGPDGRPMHGTALLAAIEEAVGQAGGWSEIELIAVGIGPGSFTGLRIGVSTARALAQARRLPIVGVGSLAALASGLGELPEAEERNRLAVIDARRGEVFAGLDEGSGPGEPIVCPPEGLVGALGAEVLAGALAAGDGSLRFRSEIEAAGVEVLPDTSSAHRLSARQVCLLGALMAPGEPQEIRPMYLRRPDAERWLERDRRN